MVALSCTPEDMLEVSVTKADNGVVIENIGSTDCAVFVTSPEGNQQFELVIGESVTVRDVSQPIEVSVVSLRN